MADRRALVTQPSYLNMRRRRRRSGNSGACTTNSALHVSADHFEWVVVDAGAASRAVLTDRYRSTATLHPMSWDERKRCVRPTLFGMNQHYGAGAETQVGFSSASGFRREEAQYEVRRWRSAPRDGGCHRHPLSMLRKRLKMSNTRGALALHDSGIDSPRYSYESRGL